MKSLLFVGVASVVVVNIAPITCPAVNRIEFGVIVAYVALVCAAVVPSTAERAVFTVPATDGLNVIVPTVTVALDFAVMAMILPLYGIGTAVIAFAPTDKHARLVSAVIESV